MERPNVRQKNHEKKVAQQDLIKTIQQSSKERLLPELKNKMEETTNLIVNLINERGEEKVNNIQIMSLISKGSLRETALGGNIEYTSQEINDLHKRIEHIINQILDNNEILLIKLERAENGK